MSNNEDNNDTTSINDSNTSTNTNDKFYQVIEDFTKDLLTTFPELNEKVTSINEDKEKCLKYCVDIYPKKFFDILYKNLDLFNEECMLLPNINFSLLMKDETVTEKTRDTIWKYLQLILFTILDTLDDKNSFGDTSKLFEAINQTELHKKISETMENMKDFFVNEPDASGTPFDGMKDDFNPEKLKSHLDGLMDGKIGRLAKEIAEETAQSVGDQEEFMKNVMKNPSKIMSLVKDIGGKLENKIKSGEVKESELLEEATELIDKMKDIPGIKEMMSKMGMNGKMDFKGMANKMQQTMNQAKTKERLKKKMEERKAQISKKTEDTFVVKVDDSAPLRSKKPKKKKTKKPSVHVSNSDSIPPLLQP
jgi:hypothetical protein